MSNRRRISRQVVPSSCLPREIWIHNGGQGKHKKALIIIGKLDSIRVSR